MDYHTEHFVSTQQTSYCDNNSLIPAIRVLSRVLHKQMLKTGRYSVDSKVS